MGRQVEFPRYNIVSTRVSDQELDTLEKLSGRLSLSVSEMLRRSLQHLSSEAESLQLQQGI
jgi:hypothetical protein